MGNLSNPGLVKIVPITYSCMDEAQIHAECVGEDENTAAASVSRSQ